MARPQYPSDEKRRKTKPAVRIHHSIKNHPKTAGIWATLEGRGMLVELWRLASERHASKTDDTLTLGYGDLESITCRRRRDVALSMLRSLCVVMGYTLHLHGEVVSIQIRNFARKQGYSSAPSVVVAEIHSATPDASESESESESEEDKKHTTYAPQSADADAPDPDSVSPEEILEGWRSICVPKGLPNVREITKKRRNKLRLRIREHPTFAWWNLVFTKIQRLPGDSFFFGNGQNGWKGSFDWLIANDGNALKVLEGNYDATH